MQSILATGATLQKRKEYIKNELHSLSISKFDQCYVKADNSIKIVQIRNLITQLHTKPVNGKLRAGIILEAEKATIEAQNALLKLLEEPPKTTYLFLSAPNPKHLLPTIASRCRIVQLHHDAPLLDKDTEKEMKRIFGLIKGVAFYKIKGDPLNKDALKNAFELAEKLGKNRGLADQFLHDALLYVRQQYLEKPGKEVAYIARKLLLSRRLISANVNPRQVLENLFLDL